MTYFQLASKLLSSLHDEEWFWKSLYAAKEQVVKSREALIP